MNRPMVAVESVINEVVRQRERRQKKEVLRTLVHCIVILLIWLFSVVLIGKFLYVNKLPMQLAEIVSYVVGICIIVYSVTEGISSFLKRESINIPINEMLLKLYNRYDSVTISKCVSILIEKEKNVVDRFKNVFNASKYSTYGISLATLTEYLRPYIQDIIRGELPYKWEILIGLIISSIVTVIMMWFKIHGIHNRIDDLANIDLMIVALDMLKIDKDKVNVKTLNDVVESGPASMMSQEEYHNERSVLLKGREECFEKVDDAIFKWSAGAFAVTVTLIQYIGLPQCMLSLLMIVSAWGMLIVSMAAYLVAYFFARDLFDYRISTLDESYLTNTDFQDKEKENALRNQVDWCNYIQVGAFLLGCVLFLVYSTLNLL